MASNKLEYWIDQYNRPGLESVSGLGSYDANTSEIQAGLKEIIRKYNITSIVDMPCGDWHWMQHVDLSSIYYYGYDIVPQLIIANCEKYGSARVEFKVHDAITGTLPKVDLVICRDFLFHLTNEQIFQVLGHLDCKYLLTTTMPKILNVELCAGQTWRKLNVCSTPFNFNDPEYVIQENNSEACQGRIVGLFRR